jgi:hypothetical protein
MRATAEETVSTASSLRLLRVFCRPVHRLIVSTVPTATRISPPKLRASISAIETARCLRESMETVAEVLGTDGAALSVVCPMSTFPIPPRKRVTPSRATAYTEVSLNRSDIGNVSAALR